MTKNYSVKRNLFTAAAVTLVALALASCGKKEPPTVKTETVGEKEFYVIKTWRNNDCTEAPWVVGDRLGIFEEEGIKMVYTGMLLPPQRVASVINGNNDVGGAHPNAVAIARHGGARIRGVAVADIEPPQGIDDPFLQHMWWVTRKDGPLKTWDDVRKHTEAGKKVKIQMIGRNSCMDFLTDKLLAKHNISNKNIEYITIPDVEGVLSLKRGLVDMTIPHPPFYHATLETEVAHVLNASREIVGENGGTYVYYFSDDFIDNPANKEAIKRFVRAIKRIHRYANVNQKQVAEWTTETIGVPVRANHWYAETGRIKREYIQEWIDGAIDGGVIPADTKVTVDDVVTFEFHEYGDPTPAEKAEYDAALERVFGYKARGASL